MNGRIPNLAVALIAGAGLAYEVLLLRLFAIAQWHHFAYLAISLALLGFGVAGTALVPLQRYTQGRERGAFAAAAVGFAATAPAAWILAQRLPFNALEIYWDPMQPLWLAAQYLLLLPPFFCVAAAVCLAFQAAPVRSARTYGADLAGAGLGAAAIVALLFWLSPAANLRVLALTGAAAALPTAGLRGRAVALAAAVAVLAAPGAWLAPQPSQYKGLTQQLEAPGAEVIARRHSPLGELDLVRSPRVPVRYAPGLSLGSPHSPPEQLALFTDADAKTAVLRPDGEPPRYLNWLTSALPYTLRERPRTLILGAGGGADIWQAKLHDAAAIEAVEVNPQVIDLVRAHGGQALAGVDVHIAEARAHVRRTQARHDVIQLALLGAPAAAAAGVNSLQESYVHTVEAYGDYLDRLAPDGLLTVTHWVNIPPRAAIKAFATAVAALERGGVEEPRRHLAMIRSWKTATLLVKPTPLTVAETGRIRAFAERRSFDLAHLPTLEPGEANRYNRLDRPYFNNATRALLGGDRAAFFRDYPFHVRPATDDRPYFFHFFKWRLLPRLFEQRGHGGLAQLGAGYPVLAFALLQATAIAGLLILAPLGGRTGALRQTPVRRIRLLVFCLAVGLGFLFVEIAFIQRFQLILGHPVYAVALVLAGFLTFAGLGSALAQRLRDRIWPAVAGIVALSGTYLVLLPAIGAPLAAQPAAVRVAACGAMVAPLAACMGVPYARALRRLGSRDPAVIPWAWAINGFASVVAAILATLLAVHLGFTAVVLMAMGLYLLAAASYRF